MFPYIVTQITFTHNIHLSQSKGMGHIEQISLYSIHIALREADGPAREDWVLFIVGCDTGILRKRDEISLAPI